MIDLHAHTNASDGSYSPSELIQLARDVGVHILAITDHDTFGGYELAADHAINAGVDLIRGIELSARLQNHSAHLLGYFTDQGIPSDFNTWILEMQTSRRSRNIRLITRLRELGLDITVEEAERLGCSNAGRPHFARLLVEKGCVGSLQQAFDEYLDESARAYIHREEPELTASVQRIKKAGGIASLAHPVRLSINLNSLLPMLCDAGLNAIEAYHSDHSPELTAEYLELAQRHNLLVTGGSDFHGSSKSDISLGTGRNGNVKVPVDLVDKLRGNMR